MGWTWYHCRARKRDGSPDVKAECDSLFSPGCRVVKSALVGSTYYAAVNTVGTEEVWAAVVHTSVNNSDYFDFGYKDMDETVGPYKFECPPAILDLLTPTDSGFANVWRERCREEQRYHAWFKSLPDGARVKWTVPTSFYRGFREGEVITLVKGPRNRYARRSPRVWWLEERPGFFVRRKDVSFSDLEPEEVASCAA